MKDFSCFQNIDAIQQIFSADQLNTITMFEKGFNTFGMNLFAIPQDYGFWSPMILFPVICFASNVGKLFRPQRMTATSEARHAALMFEQEALVQYNYVPHGLSESAEENTNSKKKKKK